jgi:hypothetical protein
MKLNSYFNQVTDPATRRSFWKMQEGVNELTGLMVGQERFLVANKTTDAFFLSLIANGVDPDMIYSTFKTASDAMTSGRGDSLIVLPGSHSLAANPAIDQNMSIFRGAQGWPLMNKRCRLGMSTTFTPMLEVSGYGNLFQDIYTMHGTAAGDYVGWLISGARNAFKGVHFGGPMIAAQGGHASYNGVYVTGSECSFDECVFGTNTIERDELTPNVTLGAGTLTYFNNCLFLCALTDTDPYFVAVENTTGYTQAYFNNCKFLAFSANHANKAAVAFTFSGASSADIILDQLCAFSGVTHLAVTGSMKYIWTPTIFAATADELNLININSATF